MRSTKHASVVDLPQPAVPETCPGMICYKTFMARDTRCENCPALDIGQTKNASALVKNKNYGLQVHALATEISWNGETACLLTCHELKNQS